MSEPLAPADELSLEDLISFLQEGWRTIAAVTAVSSGFGLGVAFLLPEKFAASALLEPAKVLGNPIEPPAVLAEKMRSPTFYSAATLQACGYAEMKSPAQEFVNDLQPRVARQSAFVSVSIKGASPGQARQCIVAVVDDVKKDQSFQVAQQIAVARDRLKREQEKLAIAERFVSLISNRALAEGRSGTANEIAGSTLNFVVMQSKLAEIAELKNGIDKLSLDLAEPQTRLAALATPIYAPDVKVEPKRSLIAAAALLGGALLGLVVTIGWRVLGRQRERAAA